MNQQTKPKQNTQNFVDWDKKISDIAEITQQNSAAIKELTETTKKNSAAIKDLIRSAKQNSETTSAAIKDLTETIIQNRDDIKALITSAKQHSVSIKKNTDAIEKNSGDIKNNSESIQKQNERDGPSFFKKVQFCAKLLVYVIGLVLGIVAPSRMLQEEEGRIQDNVFQIIVVSTLLIAIALHIYKYCAS